MRYWDIYTLQMAIAPVLKFRDEEFMRYRKHTLDLDIAVMLQLFRSRRELPNGACGCTTLSWHLSLPQPDVEDWNVAGMERAACACVRPLFECGDL